MYNNDSMDNVRNIINSSNSEFKVDKFKINSCGYIGNVFYTKKLPNLNDPYRLATELIQNKLIYEIKIVDLSRCSVYYFYRDYDSRIGDNISIIKGDFDKHAKLLHQKRNNGNVFLSIVTLAIKEEELEKISKLNTYMKLIDFLRFLMPFSKPRPNVDIKDADESGVIALINYHHQDFKIEIFDNLDGFCDGHLIEGYVQGDAKETVLQLIERKSSSVYEGKFIRDNKSNYVSENGDIYISDYIEPSQLEINQQYIAIHVYLDFNELKQIHQMESFNQIIEYLMNKEPMSHTYLNETQTVVNDDDALPF